MRNSNDNNYETVRYQKFSFWTVLKVLVFCFFIAFVVNTGSYSLVGFNHFFSKAIGLASDAVEFCQQCLQALN